MSKFRYPFILSALIILGLFSGCDSKQELFSRKEISSNLYLEKFHSFQAGVFGDVLSLYITDSVSFRTFVMNKEDKEHVYYEFIDSTKIAFVKISRRKMDYGRKIDSLVFDIPRLKFNGKFE